MQKEQNNRQKKYTAEEKAFIRGSVPSPNGGYEDSHYPPFPATTTNNVIVTIMWITAFIVFVLACVFTWSIFFPKTAEAQEITHIVDANEDFTMQWEASTGNPDTYTVYKSIDGGAFEEIDDVAEAEYDDQGADLQRHKYQVVPKRTVTIPADVAGDPPLIIPQVGPASDLSDRIVTITRPGKPGKPVHVPTP